MSPNKDGWGGLWSANSVVVGLTTGREELFWRLLLFASAGTVFIHEAGLLFRSRIKGQCTCFFWGVGVMPDKVQLLVKIPRPAHSTFLLLAQRHWVSLP